MLVPGVSGKMTEGSIVDEKLIVVLVRRGVDEEVSKRCRLL